MLYWVKVFILQVNLLLLPCYLLPAEGYVSYRRLIVQYSDLYYNPSRLGCKIAALKQDNTEEKKTSRPYTSNKNAVKPSKTAETSYIKMYDPNQYVSPWKISDSFNSTTLKFLFDIKVSITVEYNIISLFILRVIKIYVKYSISFCKFE